ncbi:MAG TPA: hypothetical protein VJM32_03895 [Candidatus Saccharimonadales bacterium]|nr:hypothetical protein [Candidatus Saccharimonadales bacterium]
MLAIATLASVGIQPILPASPASADPVCQTGGVYILWARGSGQTFNEVEAQRFQGHVNYALNAAGVTTHEWAELGNLDGAPGPGQVQNHGL